MSGVFFGASNVIGADEGECDAPDKYELVASKCGEDVIEDGRGEDIKVDDALVVI